MLRSELLPGGQYSRKVQQRQHCLTRSTASRCVLTRTNKARDDAYWGLPASTRSVCEHHPGWKIHQKISGHVDRARRNVVRDLARGIVGDRPQGLRPDPTTDLPSRSSFDTTSASTLPCSRQTGFVRARAACPCACATGGARQSPRADRVEAQALIVCAAGRSGGIVDRPLEGARL